MPRQRRWLSGRHACSRICYCDLWKSLATALNSGRLAPVAVLSAAQMHGRQEEFTVRAYITTVVLNRPTSLPPPRPPPSPPLSPLPFPPRPPHPTHPLAPA